MKILVCEPGKQPYPKEIADTLEAKQEIVGGLIEPVYFEPDGDAIILCNEEGLIYGLPPNRPVNGLMLVGTFFIAGDREIADGEREFCSLTDGQIAKYTEQFALHPMIAVIGLPDDEQDEEIAPLQC